MVCPRSSPQQCFPSLPTQQHLASFRTSTAMLGPIFPKMRDSYSTASAWFWLSSAIGFGVFAFSAMRTLGLLRGWAGSVVLAISPSWTHLAPSFTCMPTPLASKCYAFWAPSISGIRSQRTITIQLPERAHSIAAVSQVCLIEAESTSTDLSPCPMNCSTTSGHKRLRRHEQAGRPSRGFVSPPRNVFPAQRWMSHAECRVKVLSVPDPIVLVATVNSI